MMTAAEINASQKAGVSQWFEWADKTLDETSKWMDLNLSTCRDTMEEMASCCQRACDVHDWPSAFQWQSGAFKPFAERSAEYGARLVGLASGSGVDFGRSFESQWESLGQQMNAWMGQSMPLLPRTGQMPSADYLRNAMQAFDSVWETMRQNMVQAQQLATAQGPMDKPALKKAARKNQH